MQGQWPLVLDLCLLIHLSHTSNQLKEDVSVGIPSDIDSLEGAPHGGMQVLPHHANWSEIPYLPSGGIGYHPVISEPDKLYTYTGLNDYDTLFEARHGRGVLDNMPKSGEEAIATPSIGMTPVTLSARMTENPMVRIRPTPDSRQLHPSGKNMFLQVHVVEQRVVSPVSTGHITGEGAAIFTDLTETMLTTLDQQMAYKRHIP